MKYEVTSYRYSPPKVSLFDGLKDAEKAAMQGRDIATKSEPGEFEPNTVHYFATAADSDMPHLAFCKLKTV